MELPGSGRYWSSNNWILMCSWAVLQVLTAVLHTCAGDIGSVPSNNKQPMRRFIKIATVQTEPFVRLNWSPGLIANERYEGLYIDLIRELAREVGFTYQLYLVPDGKTGHLGENGRWNGLMGELESGSASLALAPVIATDDRRQVAHFLTPLSRVKISLLARDHRKRHLPYGIVLDSEAFHAIKTDAYLHENLKSHGILYVSSIMEGMDKAHEGVCNLLVSAQLAEYYADQEPCDLTAEPFHTFDDLVFSLAAAEDAALSDEISSTLDRLMTGTSVMDRLENTWLRGSCLRRGALPTSLGTTTHADSQRRWTKLTITSMLMEPYLMRSSKRGVDYEGYIADIVRQMASVMSVDYEWKIQRNVGRQRTDRSWTGMIGDIMEGESDLAAAPFVVTDNQVSLLSFSKPFLESTLSLVVQAPSGNTPMVMVEDLLDNSNYDFGVIHKSRLAKQLKRSKQPIFKDLWRKLKGKGRENRILSIHDGLQRVRAGQFALVLESPEATYLASRQPCDLLSLSQYLTVTQYAFATKKDSPLIEHLNLALLQLQEKGVLQALFHKWWNTDECVGVDSVHHSEESNIEPAKPTTTTAIITRQMLNIPDSDLDRLLGLVTDRYPHTFPDNESDYQEVDDSRHRELDLERIFFTSPVGSFTPKSSNNKNTSVNASSTVATNSPRVIMPMANTTTITTPAMTGTISPGDKSDDIVKETRVNPTDISPSDREILDSVAQQEHPKIVITTTTPDITKRKKNRRKGRTRRPGKRKGRKRPITTPRVSTTSPPPTTVEQTPLPHHIPRDFDKHIDWVFATELPRPDKEDYEDYDNYNFSSSDTNYTLFTPNNQKTALTRNVNTDSPLVTTETVSVADIFPDTSNMDMPSTVTSNAPRTEEESSTAVLVVVLIHLVIFGWPVAEPVNCADCHR